MAYLHSETVEEIIKHRPQFVAVKHYDMYEYSTWRNLANELTFREAARKAALAVLQSNRLCETYDPHSRWYLRDKHFSDDKQLEWWDSWQCSAPATCYVEEWLPEQGKQGTTCKGGHKVLCLR